MKLLAGIAAAIAALLAAVSPAGAALDLSRASVTRLENGLTLIILEDHTLPVVSVQSAYRTGGRDDPAGRMGLAHFMEHMAFRQSKNFPGTGLVDGIYAAGGEWHGYTWIDQTTYFATVPKENLDLLLRVEADRMGALVLDPEDVKAEAGAVVAEMNGYANDPTTILFDAVLATMFQVHPYRLNTIGYEEEVKAISHADIVNFYKEHFRPANAVLAVAGDVDAAAVEAAVKKRFGALKTRPATLLPPASEPPRRGERRTRLEGATDRKLFKIAYPAPPARSEDFAAFLVLQELAGGGAGASFLQNDWGVAAHQGSALYGVTNDLTTWFIPTADPYVFMISGSIDTNGGETAIETAIQKKLSALSSNPIDETQMQNARAAVKRELVLDVQTTEDAAHQLAYFDSIGAFDTLETLSKSVAAVSTDDIMRLARHYLRRDQRTIGWFVPGETALESADLARTLTPAAPRAGDAPDGAVIDPPYATELANGAAVIVQSSPLSPTAAITVVARGDYTSEGDVDFRRGWPAPGYTAFSASGLADEFPAMAARLAGALAAADPADSFSDAPSRDPSSRLHQVFARYETPAAVSRAAPLVIAGAGAMKNDVALAVIESAFANAPRADRKPAFAALRPDGDITETIAEPKAQAALGYITPAPGGGDKDALAWRMALYIFSHQYGGRLGAEAISQRGLLYYIGADYAADAASGVLTLFMGVDPAKLAATRTLLKAELERLVNEPPSAEEIAEAKHYLIGRRISAAQSNDEIADRLARDQIEIGAPRDAAALKTALDRISRDDVLAILPAFAGGAVVSIETGSVKAQE